MGGWAGGHGSAQLRQEGQRGALLLLCCRAAAQRSAANRTAPPPHARCSCLCRPLAAAAAAHRAEPQGHRQDEGREAEEEGAAQLEQLGGARQEALRAATAAAVGGQQGSGSEIAPGSCRASRQDAKPATRAWQLQLWQWQPPSRTSSPSELRAMDWRSCGGTVSSSGSPRKRGGGRGPDRCCDCSKGERGCAVPPAAAPPGPSRPRRRSSFSN